MYQWLNNTSQWPNNHGIWCANNYSTILRYIWNNILILIFLYFSRLRLEYYEQSCAVDSVTKKCAGPTSECRKAMLGILGTELHTNCACKGTELNQLYGCLGWQRLLWVNPCVGKRKILRYSLSALSIYNSSNTLNYGSQIKRFVVDNVIDNGYM